MTTVDYSQVLWDAFPDAHWSMSNNDYETLVWHSDSPKPSREVLDGLWGEVSAARELAAVQAARRARYEAETDPMAFRLLRQEPGVTVADYVAAVEAIRADLPYPA